MKLNKNLSEELNSGLLYFGSKKTIRDGKKRIVSNEFLPFGKLKYKLKNFNYESFTSYFGIESKIDLKVKVYKVEKLKESLLIKIDKNYYDIVKMDEESSGQFVYLYLQRRESLDD